MESRRAVFIIECVFIVLCGVFFIGFAMLKWWLTDAWTLKRTFSVTIGGVLVAIGVFLLLRSKHNWQ